MGYYTHFVLTITPEADEELKELLTEDRRDSGRYVGNFDYYNGNFNGFDWKWYDHEEDMIFLSETYPDHLFQLVGDGEETGDYWVEFYKGGKYYRVVLVMPVPDFDESLLGQG